MDLLILCHFRKLFFTFFTRCDENLVQGLHRLARSVGTSPLLLLGRPSSPPRPLGKAEKPRPARVGAGHCTFAFVATFLWVFPLFGRAALECICHQNIIFPSVCSKDRFLGHRSGKSYKFWINMVLGYFWSLENYVVGRIF